MSEGEASTTRAATALASSREQGPEPVAAGAPTSIPGEDGGEWAGRDVARAAQFRPYERRPGDPLYRPLRIYAVDPATSPREGGTVVVNVPYEPLTSSLEGRLFTVDARDGGNQREYRTLDLNDRSVLLTSGRAPSASDPLFHQQMVYAVCSLVYASFRKALGRDLAWGFPPDPDDPARSRLRLRPYAACEENAWYDHHAGELGFGYYRARPDPQDPNRHRELVFTCLSHDIVAHEVTHALLDGLRSYFLQPTSRQVLAFHEGFADLVAILQRFSYSEVVRGALGRARGDARRATRLTEFARQMGDTLGVEGGLRSAVEGDGSRERFDEGLEEHQMGEVLLRAVFEAYATVLARKVERDIRLATGGTSVLPPGELPSHLIEALTERAGRLAEQFQALCIRAIDYCPPVDVQLGEFLRAVITADHDLVPDDPWRYREAWIEAFRSFEITVQGVDFLSEDALLWREPEEAVGRIWDLTFARLRFEGDPGRPAGARELLRQARALWRVVTEPRAMGMFGLAGRGDPRLDGDDVGSPRVQSIRSSRRVGPDGQVVFDLVAEVTQVRMARGRGAMPDIQFKGGSTVIIGPDGTVRYIIRKSVLNRDRLERQREFSGSEEGGRYWRASGGAGELEPVPDILRSLHAGRLGRAHGEGAGAAQ